MSSLHRSTRRRFALTAHLTIALAAVAGCGGEDERPSELIPIADAGDTGLPIFEAGGNDSSTGADGTVGPDAETDTAPSDGAATPDTSPVNDSGSVGNDAAPTDTSMSTTDGTVVLADGFTRDTSLDGVIFADTSASSDSADPDTFEAGPDASVKLVPIGTACTSNATCDPTGAGIGKCSNQLAPPDSVDPSPTCLAYTCEKGKSGADQPCGQGDIGWCMNLGPSAVCFDGCSFGASGAASGCLLKTACNPRKWTRTASGVDGNGYCSAGCKVDGDCTGGQVCQSEDGRCVATKVAYAKTTGQACASSDECICKLAAPGAGVCESFCVTGDATGCPSGYVCDPGLPKTDGSGTLFSSVPTGLAGWCHKSCNNDTECVAPSTCVTNVATATKVCRIP